MNLAFELSMPNNNAWNGKWSGAGKLYVVVRSVARPSPEIVGRDFYYAFGDGWAASVSVREVVPGEAKYLRAHSAGFCGYDWMIADILAHGRIRTAEERAQGRSAVPAGD